MFVTVVAVLLLAVGAFLAAGRWGRELRGLGVLSLGFAAVTLAVVAAHP